jgi:ribosomal protein L37AE/L43A
MTTNSTGPGAADHGVRESPDPVHRDHSKPGKACPLCGDSARFLFSKHAIGILQCRHCGHQFADLEIDTEHVQRTYDDRYFTGGGAGYADYLVDGPLRFGQARRYAKMLRRFTVPGYMLDVGAAAGYLLSGFCHAGWKGEGIEPNAKMAALASEKLGVAVQPCALETFSSKRLFDLVTLIQVLPHLSDVDDCVAQVSSWIRPGGLCLVESWDRGSLTARLLGSNWHEYSPPSVLHWFDRDGMNDLMTRHGLRPVMHGHSIKWISAAHGKSLLEHAMPRGATGRFARSLVRFVPDRFRLPYPGDDLVWMLYEKEK